jgi:hypothetical protein
MDESVASSNNNRRRFPRRFSIGFAGLRLDLALTKSPPQPSSSLENRFASSCGNGEMFSSGADSSTTTIGSKKHHRRLTFGFRPKHASTPAMMHKRSRRLSTTSSICNNSTVNATRQFFFCLLFTNQGAWSKIFGYTVSAQICIFQFVPVTFLFDFPFI